MFDSTNIKNTLVRQAELNGLDRVQVPKVVKRDLVCLSSQGMTTG
jgi:hypothetical protein